MPVLEIPAKTWSYTADLGDAPAAAAYSATYVARKNDGTFDDQFFSGIRVFRGEADPHFVRIKPTIDGIQETLMLGVVDRNGAVRQRGGALAGFVSGRDLIALALDRYPSAPTTLDGFTVNADGALAPRETFKGALRRLAEAVGLTVLYDCPDYKLGRSVPVTTDRTFGEVMQELLRPLRLSEKWRVDVWVEGTTLRVARRGQEARGTVIVDAARIKLERMEKTALPAVDGVRVEGASYEAEEDEIGGTQVAGLVSITGQPYGTPFGPFTVTKTVAGKTIAYVDEGQQYYDAKGRMTSSFRKVTYLSSIRTEKWEKTCEYYVDSTLPYDGAPKRETETYKVDQIWVTQQGEEIVRQRDASWQYFGDNGDLLAEDVFEVEKDEQAKLPLPVNIERTSRFRYRRSAGRVLRDYETTEVDPGTGAVSRTFGTTDQGPFNADAGQKVSGVAHPGRRMAQKTVAAGPEPTSGKFRLEKSEYLGSEADCEAVRQDLIDEHASVRLGVSLDMEPDLRVKPGKVLTVQGAPGWWPTAQFTVIAVSKEAESRGMGMRVDGVAWLAAP